jgi:hypothetical protein
MKKQGKIPDRFLVLQNSSLKGGRLPSKVLGYLIVLVEMSLYGLLNAFNRLVKSLASGKTSWEIGNGNSERAFTVFMYHYRKQHSLPPNQPA